MTPAEALAALEARGEDARAAAMAADHKAPRRYLGVPVPQIDELTDAWRAGLTLDGRLDLAESLWASDIHEARIAAAKLLTQARLRPDDRAWALIRSWVPQFDARAIADAVAIAGQKRLVADPSRLDLVETWTRSPHMWVRRAALIMTLPWAKMNFPKAGDLAVRDRVLGWCAACAGDRDRAIRQAVAGWIRDLSKHDAPRARAFLDAHGAALPPLARTKTGRHPDRPG